MKKTVNIFVNILNFLAALVSLVSAIIVWQVLPSGQGFKGNGELGQNLFWGIARHDWSDIHIISSLIFFGLIIAHLVLHWCWIKNLPRMLKQ